MRHSQDLGKRERLERSARQGIKKQRDRERLKRLQEIREHEEAGEQWCMLCIGWMPKEHECIC